MRRAIPDGLSATRKVARPVNTSAYIGSNLPTRRLYLWRYLAAIRHSMGSRGRERQCLRFRDLIFNKIWLLSPDDSQRILIVNKKNVPLENNTSLVLNGNVLCTGLGFTRAKPQHANCAQLQQGLSRAEIAIQKTEVNELLLPFRVPIQYDRKRLRFFLLDHSIEQKLTPVFTHRVSEDVLR